MNDEFRMEQRTVNRAGGISGGDQLLKTVVGCCGTAYNIDRCHQYVCYRSYLSM